jgi:nucleoside-diphosphate-sugar epimerase
MKIFVTGATGFIGSAIVPELIDAGHQVLGLVRSDVGAKFLAAAGADVHRGSLDDLESLRSGAAAADAVIHTAFIHEFSKFKENCEIDRRAIEALGSALAGSNRLLVVTSGTGVAAPTPGLLATEEDPPYSGTSAPPRVASEEAAASVAARGVRVAVVRLPQVHNPEKQGLVTYAIAVARGEGVSIFVGDGANRWPAVHLLDAVRLYRLVLEKGVAGARYHAVAEEGVPFREIAQAIGRRVNVPVVSKSREEAAEHFGWLANFTLMDSPASSERTRKLLGWQPTHTGLIADLDAAQYFEPRTDRVLAAR